MTFLHCTHHNFHLSLIPSPIDWATQAESNIPHITKREPPKNKISSCRAKTTASVMHSLRPSWNMSAINELAHALGMGAGHLNLFMQSERAFWKKHPFVIVPSPVMPPHSSNNELHHLCHLPHLHKMTEWGRCPLKHQISLWLHSYAFPRDLRSLLTL